MAIFSTVTSIMVALVPETHGPTLLKQKLAKLGRDEKRKDEVKGKLQKVLGVYKQALKRPVLFFFTGELSLDRLSTNEKSRSGESDLELVSHVQSRLFSSFRSTYQFSTVSCESS